MPASPIKRAWRVLRILLIVYLLIVLLMMFMEESLLFFPSNYPDGIWQPSCLVFEDAWFTAPANPSVARVDQREPPAGEHTIKLHGWFVPCENPRAVALFAHGNGGNLSHREDYYRALHQLGVAVLAFDYRGYGRSEGSPTEAGIMADGRAARAWLAKKVSIPESEIVLMGESLGGAVAVQLASEAPARALILENTFSSAPEVAAFHYPWLPVKLAMRTKLDSASLIGKYHGPLLEVHGDADTIVPFQLGRKLFSVANEPKQFVVIPGGDHNDPRTELWYAALDKFLANLPQK